MILSLLDEAIQAGAGQAKACQVLGVSERTIQRWRGEGPNGKDRRGGRGQVPANKLSEEERAEVLSCANSPAFRHLSPKQIVPRLADQGRYIASESTFYRILRQAGQLTHRSPARPPSARPTERVATGPEQVWSWDITYLNTPVVGRYFYLYLFLDVFSRKIVGWEVHLTESVNHSCKMANRLLTGLKPSSQKLVLHSDNGNPMRGFTMKATLERLGVVPSYSRPNVSDDNPFSESLFRTLKYRPSYPKRFETVEQARGWVCQFVQWYNYEHLHSQIGYVTPAARHSGEDVKLLERRREVYCRAQAEHPVRFGSRVRQWSRPAEVVLHRTSSPPRPDRKLLAQTVSSN